MKSEEFIIIAKYASQSELNLIYITSLLEAENIEYNIFNRNNISIVGGWSAEALELSVRQKDADKAKKLLSSIE